jgi:hypothetical protein
MMLGLQLRVCRGAVTEHLVDTVEILSIVGLFRVLGLRKVIKCI